MDPEISLNVYDKDTNSLHIILEKLHKHHSLVIHQKQDFSHYFYSCSVKKLLQN